MKSVKQKALRLLAKASSNSALKAAGSASTYGYHQPKEPQGVVSVCKSIKCK